MVELLVVATIIIVISTIGVVSFRNAGVASRDGKRKADLETVRQALVIYRSEGTQYPGGGYDGMIETLNADGYISNPVPQDPGSNSYHYGPRGANNTGFCLCAQLEDTSAGNSSDNNCTFSGTTHYCLENPN